MNSNDFNVLAKRFDKVIEKLIDDINERFNLYNNLIFELDERLIEQDKRIKELEENETNN